MKHAASEYGREQAHANGIESVWSVIKRGLRGGANHPLGRLSTCKPSVDEFTFRLHKGNVDVDTQDRLDARFHMMPQQDRHLCKPHSQLTMITKPNKD